MERNLSVERLYTLGDFQNIKFSNTINGVPVELASNERIVALLFAQSALSCDIAYLEYKKRREAMKDEKVKDVLAALKEEREATFMELKAEIDSVYDSRKLTKESTDE